MADQVKLIVPTPINLLTAANATFLQQNGRNATLEILLPSLRRRALLVIKETGVLPIQIATPEEESFTR